MEKRKRDKERREKKLKRLKRKINKLLKVSSDESSRSQSPVMPHEPHDEEPGTPEQHLNPICPDPSDLGQQHTPTAEGVNIEIDAEILQAMGSVDEVITSGPPIHEEIAQRWVPILTKGLKKEEKTSLINLYTPFVNVPAMITPKLNAELSAAMTEPVRKRDEIIATRQKHMAAALSAIGCGLQCFLTKGNKSEGVKYFNDAAKIIGDTFHNKTVSRRILIQNVVNKEMKASLQGEPDEFLFGKSLTEHIKTTRAVQKSAQVFAVKKPIKPVKPKSLNWRAPLPKQNKDSRHSGGGGKKKDYVNYRKGRTPQQQRNYKK